MNWKTVFNEAVQRRRKGISASKSQKQTNKQTKKINTFLVCSCSRQVTFLAR